MATKAIKNTTIMETTPFIKWVGGKRQLLPELRKHIPVTYNRYWEPFLGGGALLFDLQPQEATITDLNPELVNAYTVVKDNLDKLIFHLTQHEENHNEDYYYDVRSCDRNDYRFRLIPPVQKAARFIYLNKTCYNGLWRVNKKGQNNTPIGSNKGELAQNVFNCENLQRVSDYLQGKEILHADYKQINPNYGDFVYFDPPYYPIQIKPNFTAYTALDFNGECHMELKQFIDILTERGVKVLLSNSSADFIRELYQGYEIIEVDAARLVNSRVTGRGKVKELLIKNY
jgi:DNA adenine methylase